MGPNVVIPHVSASGKCMIYDTPVMLGDGSVRPIGEVVEQGLRRGGAFADSQGWEFAPGCGTVMSWNPKDGRFAPRPIEAFWRHKAPFRLVEVRLASGAYVRVTPEHPFFTLRGGRLTLVRADQLTLGSPVATPARLELEGASWDLFSAVARSETLLVAGRRELVREALRRFRRRTQIEGWRVLSELLDTPETTLRSWCAGAAVPCDRFFLILSAADIDWDVLGDRIRMSAKGCDQSFELPRRSSPELWRWIGMLAGAGRLVNGAVEFVHPHVLMHERFAESASVLGIDPGAVRHLPDHEVEGVTRSRIDSPALAAFLHEVVGIPRRGEEVYGRIPAPAFAAPVDEVQSLVDALLDTLGARRRVRAGGTEVTFHAGSGLTGDLAYLLLRLGHRGRICAQGRRSALSFRSEDPVTDGIQPRPLPGVEPDMRALRLEQGPNRLEWTDSKEVATWAGVASWPVDWDPVAGLAWLEGHGEEYVYDLTVAETHTFVAGYGGIVAHNSS